MKGLPIVSFADIKSATLSFEEVLAIVLPIILYIAKNKKLRLNVRFSAKNFVVQKNFHTLVPLKILI